MVDLIKDVQIIKKEKVKAAPARVDNPGDYARKLGWDLYVNPWWALKFQAPEAVTLCAKMSELLGPPELWDNGSFHELFWGPRELKEWRPSLHANLSGGNGKLWVHLWLPWRSGFGTYLGLFPKKRVAKYGLPETLNLIKSSKPLPGCRVLDTEVDIIKDIDGLWELAELVNPDVWRKPEEDFFGDIEDEPEI